MSSNKYRCNWCLKEGHLKSCTQCQLVDYCGVECQKNDWKKGGHKIVCAKLPKAIKEAKVKINSFTLNDYTTSVCPFMTTEAEFVRGIIDEEGEAQALCLDAMDLERGSSTKVLKILEALKCFPLSVGAWGMLGNFYGWEYKSYKFRTKECSAEALKMYDISIACARKLNPTWTETRNDELPWNIPENGTYLTALWGRALVLKDTGKTNDALRQAKHLLWLDPNEDQGVREFICRWCLELNDTEGCANLLRKHGASHDTNLAYSDVLLQFLRRKKDEILENDIKKSLYFAIKSNTYVPDLIISKENKEVDHQYISPGGIAEAETYISESGYLWCKNSDSINWLEFQKSDGVKVPSETDLIKLLKSGATFQIICSHTDLNGHNRAVSALVGTQRRSQCRGCGCEDFFWPRQLKYKHQNSADIFMHDNSHNGEHDMSSWKRWRKTKYKDVTDVPFWKILLQFYEDDSDNEKNQNEIAADPLRRGM